METKIFSLNSARPRTYNSVDERAQNIIGRRLQAARQERGLSLTALSNLLSRYGLTVHRQGISKWETGGSVPNAYQLIAICHALNIEDGVAYFTEDSEKYEELDALGRKKLDEYKADLIASGRYKPHKADCESVIRFIDMPVSTLAASAGTGAFLDEECFETLRFPVNTVPANADFGVRVRGDSMEPVYHDGQIVWVQQCECLRLGEVGVFMLDGEGFIKLYDEREPDEADLDACIDADGVIHPQPVLISYNESYGPRVVSPNSSFIIAGRVLN